MAMQEAKEPTPDTQAAVDFLGKVYPEGPWCLTSIGIDKTGVQTRTFVPETLNDMRRWIEGYNGQRNLYWHVNPVMRILEKKATREHIRSMNWLHVDIDARAGEGLTGELERCHALIDDQPAGRRTRTNMGHLFGWWVPSGLEVDRACSD